MKTETAEIAAAGYFASGLQSPGEVRGTALAGYGVGVSCAKVQTGMIDALLEVARIGCRVFVDSGAFAEVEWSPEAGALVTRRALTDSDWERRFAVYEQLAAAMGNRLYVVAPDKVGDQVETLARLVRYSSRVRAILMLRDCDPYLAPRLIVPIQRGALSLSDFAGQCLEALGFATTDARLVYGIPSKKGATSLEELRAFAASRAPGSSFHLLGLGPQSPRFEQLVDAVLAACPGAIVTCDAVRITALVGRGGSKPRPLTAARDALLAREPQLSPTEVKERTIRDVLGAESVALLLENGWRDPELHDPDGTCYVGGDACPCPDHKRAPGFERSRGGQHASPAVP